MGGDMLNGSWFSALWPVSRKTTSDDKAVIGILASEVTDLMLKVVNLWHSLSDQEVMSMREHIVNSIGVKRLVSDNDDFLMELALNEIVENFESLARSVARLSKRCVDPVYHRYEQFLNNPSQNCFQWSRWEYRWKKMERKVKKMERFVAAMTQLSQELEVLAEMEQTFRRMQANPELNRVKLLEYQKKVTLQRQEVRNLRDMSAWNRSYDYIVRLLARSLFTILERIILVFGNSQPPNEQQQKGCQHLNSRHLPRSFSFSAHVDSLVHPSQNDFYEFYSGTMGKRPVLNSGLVDRGKRKTKQRPALHSGKHLHSESKHLGHLGPFKECMSVGNDSPVIQICMPITGGSMRINDCHPKNTDNMKIPDKSSLCCRNRIYSKLSINDRLRAPLLTLGDTALALHYANVIILIERMVSSPELIDLEARDDLYNMLPTTIRTALWAKLKRCARSKAYSVYDANLGAAWSVALKQILEWLAPLAHNMVRWHSQRNFEKEHTTSKANILLVQTLHFANQAKTEAAMVELLVGLNHVCRINREVLLGDTREFTGTRSRNSVPLRRNGICNEFVWTSTL